MLITLLAYSITSMLVEMRTRSRITQIRAYKLPERNNDAMSRNSRALLTLESQILMLKLLKYIIASVL